MSSVSRNRPKMKILLVDDDVDSCEAYATLFGIFGHHSRAAEAGHQAIELASTGRWDLALVDLALPDMDGCEVARHLRRIHGRDIMLVAVTGYQGESIVNQAIDAGFDHFFVKPLAMNTLESLVSVRADTGTR